MHSTTAHTHEVPTRWSCSGLDKPQNFFTRVSTSCFWNWLKHVLLAPETASGKNIVGWLFFTEALCHCCHKRNRGAITLSRQQLGNSLRVSTSGCKNLSAAAVHIFVSSSCSICVVVCSFSCSLLPCFFVLNMFWPPSGFGEVFQGLPP